MLFSATESQQHILKQLVVRTITVFGMPYVNKSAMAKVLTTLYCIIIGKL